AELADAYGSGPYGGNPMKVQVLSPAPLNERAPSNGSFFVIELRSSKYGGGGGIRTRQGAKRKENAPVARF
ncbi:hypothetical protein, partial [Akkermansia sp.]|uniref:hypothetical protein n=1 Tax=Akkermansia sp. TaxID=1872421 RepID=UPI003AF85780